MAVGAVARFLFLAQKPFWFDECFSVEVARLSWGNFLHLLWWREANMSLYYLLLRIWLTVRAPSGQSEFFIRSLSVVTSAATLPAIYWLARQLYACRPKARRIALIAATLFAFNAYSVRYSQEARSYALFLLLATLSSGFLVAFLRNPSGRNRMVYVIVSILAVYAHFYALLLLITHWLALRWLGADPTGTDQSRAQLPAQLRRAWITIGVAVLPLLIFVVKTGAGPIRWIQRPGPGDLLRFYERLSGSTRWPLAAIFALACLAAVSPLGKNLWSRDPRPRRSPEPSAEPLSAQVWRSRFLMLWLFFPVALTALLSLARPVFLDRYMIFCLPSLLILVAAGLARLRRLWLLTIVLAAILLLCGQGIFYVYGHDFDDERDAAGAATDFILDHTQTGDAIIFHIAASRIPYEFYRSLRAGEDTASPSFRRQLGPEILFPSHGAGLDYRDFTGKPTAALVRTASPVHPRTWIVLMHNGATGKPDATTVMLTSTLPESYPKMVHWQFKRVEVMLYSKP
ncbi:MAG TPA: hypothetical protein VGM18_00725 [Candidatus Sulfotelmatobacter sp.]|jgi:mannosyltransferase